MNKLFNLKKSKINSEKIPNVPETEKKADIKKYVDQEGLTIKKLETGLWFVKNFKYFNYLFYGALILISIVTWPWFIYSFGHYVIVGMKDDNKLITDLIATEVNHEAVLSQKALPLQFGSLKSIKLSGNSYDFYINVTNPNEKHSAKFSYYIQTGDAKTGDGENFILPGDNKYLLILAQQLERSPINAEFYIDKINFERIIPKKYSDWQMFKNERMDFIINDKIFNPAKATILSEKLNLSELSFSASNNSAYNYYEVNFTILLKGITGIAGVNKYKAINFYSGETKNVNTTWPGSLGAIKEIEIIPEIDITNEDNYINFEGGAGEEK
ncbi:hypothetical protein DRH27_01190 [Candidatus Falkowbacteria bacterium]|nr:MAG: hypothetical protein DRH27_01190 [Candidatus Falkowbacteria bacterium]